MQIGRAHRARMWRLLVAATAGLVLTATAAADRTPGIRDARAAARAVVVEHPTYRSIRSNAPLVTRSCWRTRRAVRCSLYRWAPNPCALDGREGICAQVMTRRIWLVEVRRRRGRAVAHVTRVTDTSAAPAQSAIARSSS
jgi:hypothetical protein